MKMKTKIDGNDRSMKTEDFISDAENLIWKQILNAIKIISKARRIAAKIMNIEMMTMSEMSSGAALREPTQRAPTLGSRARADDPFWIVLISEIHFWQLPWEKERLSDSGRRTGQRRLAKPSFEVFRFRWLVAQLQTTSWSLWEPGHSRSDRLIGPRAPICESLVRMPLPPERPAYIGPVCCSCSVTRAPQPSQAP
jgi:hypothetical protein